MDGVKYNGTLIKNGVTYYSTSNGLKSKEEIDKEQPILSFADTNAKAATTTVPPKPPKEEKSLWQTLFGHNEKKAPELPHPNKRNVLGCMQNLNPEARALADELGG